MTAKQDALYWREWGAVARLCKRDGIALPDRHELHAKALGACDRGPVDPETQAPSPCGKCSARLAKADGVSHLEFDNHWFDLALSAFRVWSKPGDIHAQMRQTDQPLTRLRWRVRELAEGNEGLVTKLLHDRFKWPVWLRQHHPDAAGTRLDHAPRSIVAEYQDSGLRVELDDLNETELTQLRDTLCRMKTGKTKDRRPKTADPAVLAEAALAECPY